MYIEYEATFTHVDKDDIRKRLEKIGAQLIRPEYMQRRLVFNLPKGHEIKGGWARVRDEGDKITMSIKIVDGDTITDQKEVCLTIDDFEQGRSFMKLMGASEKAYQETRRELWKIGDVEVTIDEWPFLEPYIEVEGTSEASVRDVSEKLGYAWNHARFCAVGTLYAEKYNFEEDVINNQTPKIVFDMENPFLNKAPK